MHSKGFATKDLATARSRATTAAPAGKRSRVQARYRPSRAVEETKPARRNLADAGGADIAARVGVSAPSVTVHEDDGVAESHDALAVTDGDRIHFARGAYDPSSDSGQFLLGHELAHVAQQRRTPAAGVQALAAELGRRGGDPLEVEADQVGRAAAAGGSAGPVLAAASGKVQRFSAAEHEEMGKAGSGNATVALADDYSLTFGEVVALAGDHFSSIEQMRLFAANTRGGAGSRLEIEYARKWKLGRSVAWKDKDPAYQEAEAAQVKRYYALAGGNQEHYAGNASHFLNPREGDTARSTPDKATDLRKEWDDRGQGKDAQAWVIRTAGVGSVASYRINHGQAIIEAAVAGAAGLPVSGAMATEAFACHYLTDSFAAGHVRTPRISAKEYWDRKVPMFYENLVGYMSQQIARYVRDVGADVDVAIPLPVTGVPAKKQPQGHLYPDADWFSEDMVWSKTKDKVRGVFAAKAPITFGDIVSLAMHDSDNANGVMAHVAGRRVQLLGDGKVVPTSDDGTRTFTAEGNDTFVAARQAVTASNADIYTAYALSRMGKPALEILQTIFDAKDRMYGAERFLPTVTLEDLFDASNPMLTWKRKSWEELLDDDDMRAAISAFLADKAKDIDEAGFEGDERKAVNQIAGEMRGDPRDVLTKVIDWTPDSGGGIGGHNQDDNARDYFHTAANTRNGRGLRSLTVRQRINLAVDVINGYISEGDEEVIWGVLSSASEEDAWQVIDHIGWDDLADYLDGAEDAAFRGRFPKGKAKKH